MSSLKITVKISSINCEKCRIRLNTAITKLAGIDQLTVDVARGVLTVIGTVEPELLLRCLRKLGKKPVVISMVEPSWGEPNNPQPLPSCSECRQSCCSDCRQGATCNIL